MQPTTQPSRALPPRVGVVYEPPTLHLFPRLRLSLTHILPHRHREHRASHRAGLRLTTHRPLRPTHDTNLLPSFIYRRAPQTTVATLRRHCSPAYRFFRGTSCRRLTHRPSLLRPQPPRILYLPPSASALSYCRDSPPPLLPTCSEQERPGAPDLEFSFCIGCCQRNYEVLRSIIIYILM